MNENSEVKRQLLIRKAQARRQEKIAQGRPREAWREYLDEFNKIEVRL